MINMFFRNKKSKTPPTISDSFPTDETPTPTRILKMADMDLFGELKVLETTSYPSYPEFIELANVVEGLLWPVQWKRKSL